ncbi:MAG: hypothetical protein FWF77_08210, partial [Defluviitaleaceae bacterium]|nr:hypothetical protein [Defluviitaleaceae bacterium]
MLRFWKNAEDFEHFCKNESASDTRRLARAKRAVGTGGICRRRHVPSKPRAVSPPKKARQARNGHRGHVSKATHSLEAGSRFRTPKKARQARNGHRGHVSKST